MTRSEFHGRHGPSRVRESRLCDPPRRRRPRLGACGSSSGSGSGWGGGCTADAIVGGLEETLSAAFGGGQGIKATLPLFPNDDGVV
jgi:hypothetical protein